MVDLPYILDIPTPSYAITSSGTRSIVGPLGPIRWQHRRQCHTLVNSAAAQHQPRRARAGTVGMDQEISRAHAPELRCSVLT
jgi:hypothetical protein